MAIARMQKLSVIGLGDDRKKLISDLMRLGVVELNAPERMLDSEDFASVYGTGAPSEEVPALEKCISEADRIIDLVTKYAEVKAPLFGGRSEISESDLGSVESGMDGIEAEISRLSDAEAKLGETFARINSCENLAASLRPWQGSDMDFSMLGGKSYRVIQGALTNNEAKGFAEALAEKTEFAEAEIVSSDGEQSFVSVLYYLPEEAEVLQALRDLGFSRLELPVEKGTVSEALEKLSKESEELAAERDECIASIAAGAPSIPRIKEYRDFLAIKKDKAETASALLVSKKTFWLDGWLPRMAADKVKALLGGYNCWYEIEDPAEGDEPPVLLLNKGFAQPFEAVTDLYATPAYRNVDPTAAFSIFYAVFFGIMFSDFAYGLILAGACLLMKKKYKLEGMLKDLVNMFVYCGISTMVFGLLFGSFFGDVITQVSTSFFHHTVNFPTLWFSPMDKPMLMLGISCGLGILHLFVGMGISGYMSIRDGHPLDALFDVGFWYILILGLIGWLGSGMTDAIPAVLGKVCMYASIIGAAGILLTGGRHNKGLGKITGGLGSLYGITSYLSDILSYSRLLALGLATSVISSVFNTLGTLGGLSFGGVLIFLLAFGIGHPYNFAINVLGSFVHTCRLQYVEFFGKFYESGGTAFAPLRENTKYVKLIKEDK